MARMYSNQASGVTVVAGVIKSISEDRQVITMTSKKWNPTEKKDEEFDIKVQSAAGFDEKMYRDGFRVTAVGYPHGKGVINAERVLVGNEAYETQDLTILRGYVKFARYNEEKTADGASILNSKGEAKSPHFDVTISVKDETTGNYVDHIVKIYNGKTENGKKGSMDIAMTLFNKFDRETAPVIATFVTGAGSPYTTKVERNGKEYINFKCSHFGCRLMDVEYVEAKERNKGAGEKTAPTPAQASPAQAAPATGFDAPEIDLGAEDEFR